MRNCNFIKYKDGCFVCASIAPCRRYRDIRSVEHKRVVLSECKPNRKYYKKPIIWISIKLF